MKEISYISLLFFITAILLPVFHSCNNSQDLLESNTDFIYTYSCGWCYGKASIKFSDYQVRFNYKPWCEAEPIEKIKTLTQNELNAFDFKTNIEKLKLLNYNSCGVCYDGCDEELIAIEGTDTTKIRFDYNDDISSITDFVNKLREVREDFLAE